MQQKFIKCYIMLLPQLNYIYWLILFKYPLSYTRFDQISDHKYGIYLYGKLSTKLISAYS